MKKALWLIAVVLSIVFLLLGLAGIVGVWVGRSYAQGFVNDVFDAADQARAESSATVAEVIAHRQELQAGLDELSAEIDSAARHLEEAPVVFMAIDRLLDGRLEPALRQLDEAGRRVYADLAGLNAAVKTLNNISLFRNRQDALDQFGAVLDRLLGDLERLDSSASRCASARRRRSRPSSPPARRSSRSWTRKWANPSFVGRNFRRPSISYNWNSTRPAPTCCA